MSLARTLDKQRYIELLPRIFQIRTAHGELIPYQPMPFQAAWHRHMYLVNPTLAGRIWVKGRGLGATMCTMIDLIMIGSILNDVVLPVVSMTEAQAQTGPIAWVKWLIDHAKPVQGHRITRDPGYESQIVFPTTGSKILPLPGNNPNRLRTYRTPVVTYDEFAYCEQQEALLEAGESCLSEGGGLTIISTIRTQTDEFARLMKHADTLGLWVHRTPTWPSTVDVTQPLPAQDVRPIAPWIDIQVQERLRRRDLTAFCRESQCEPADEDTQFLSWQLIQEACHLDFHQDRGERWRKRERDAEHVYTLGWDYARYNDFSVSHVLEHTPDGITQVYERVLRGVDTPTQNRILDHLVAKFRPDLIRIDKTGVGLGLYDYAVRAHGGRVKGIDFASKMPTGRWERRKRVTAPTRDLYANNLRTLLQDHQLHLFNDPLLKQDLHVIPYELTTTRRTAEGSHGDRFWALALAAYPTQPYRELQVATGMRAEVRARRRRRHDRRW
jgi:hypothetical protein